jgi:hypothetical protein
MPIHRGMLHALMANVTLAEAQAARKELRMDLLIITHLLLGVIGVFLGLRLMGGTREIMKIFKKKQIPISDYPTSILRVFQKSRLYRAGYEEPPHHRRLFPLGTWLQQLEKPKWGIGHRDRMSPVLPRIPAARQSKLIIREMLRRSGSLRTNHDGLVTLRWAWLKKLYSWTLKA